MSLLRVSGALLIAVVAGAGRSEPGPYPSREIRLIVQAAPGGVSDTVRHDRSRPGGD